MPDTARAARPNTSIDQRLRDRANRVVPGGMWGHQHANRLPAGYPQYFARAEGCRIWDVDGRPSIDFMCGWGPIVLGYDDPDVRAAMDRQAALGDCFNGPSERMVELAERLVDLVPHADWAMFQKNGTDATTGCAVIARAGTGRRKILVARGAYHGAVPWCNPYPLGSTPEDRAHLIVYDYNDPESLTAAADEAKGDLAAIFVAAFKHDVGKEHVLPTRAFAERARAICDATGAALVVDDVRAGFRLDMGGSWEVVGVRPDLAAWSKAIANGQPLAAITGNDRFRDSAARIFATGSFWTGAVPMAAALATLAKLEAMDGVGHMRRMGERFRAGLAAQAAKLGLPLRQSGPPQMPVLLFDDDTDRAKGHLFCIEALNRGVYLHPTHTLFLCVAHTPEAIDEALVATGEALAVVARRFDR